MSTKAAVTLLMALVALCAVTTSCATSQAGPRDGSLNEEEVNELRARLNNRLLAVPHSLARFLSYNSRGFNMADRPAETAGRSINGYKRSSSALDPLSVGPLGKRSANPFEFINLEPVYARQSVLSRGPARAYDLRWAPFDSIESSGASLADYN